MTHRAPPLISALIAGLVLVTAAGCASADTSDHNTDAWSDRMQQLLLDPDGQGGAAGTLAADSGQKTGRALVELSTIDSGEYDVLSVCRGDGVVHLQVLRRSPESDSGTFKPLTSTNVVCGATTRLPITVPGHDVVLKASGPAGTDWVAEVVTRGWQPDPDSVT